jgi:hypothetical protein
MKALCGLGKLLYISTSTESNEVFLTPADGDKFTKVQFNKLSRYWGSEYNIREHTIGKDIVSIELLPRPNGQSLSMFY